MQLTVGNLSEALSVGMHNSVICTEDVPFFDDFAIRDRNLEQTYMGSMMVEALQDICAVWPSGPLDPDLRTPLSVDVPVLLLSGTADPITPPEYAERAMTAMPSARHIVGTDQGHGQIAVGCMPSLIAGFVDAADVQAIDASCFEERSHVMPFFIDFTGPSP
jgi:pimeloyl-ACP methyl ester carboxylesterase